MVQWYGNKLPPKKCKTEEQYMDLAVACSNYEKLKTPALKLDWLVNVTSSFDVDIDFEDDDD